MSFHAADDEFDICGPMPSGVTVLEASAGTGKTFTIAALATRFVAEGTPLDQLLVVTFTRAATGELRDRVRQRLTSARRALELALSTDGEPDPELIASDDRLARMLAAGTREVVYQRREQLVQAIAEFDAATIATTHGFCQEVLGSLGIAGDIDPGPTIIDNASDPVEEIVDDLYVREFYGRSALFDRGQAKLVVENAVMNRTAPLAPAAAGSGEAPALRRELAAAARVEVDRRQRGLGVMTHDDLVTRLRQTLVDSPHGSDVAAQLRARYSVALVDEFQDTDPDQWAIMRAAFAHDDSTLVLIGDPKQAIYSFRGADVHAYLDAARQAQARPTLQTNWRSDQGLLDAYDALFSDVQLGHPEIAYRRVRAADPDHGMGLDGAPDGTPLRVRVVDRDNPAVKTTPTGWTSAMSVRGYIAQDVAADIARLLAAEPTTNAGALGAGDIAVLVRKNVQARDIKAALEQAGVPAVVNGAGSVFTTEPARHWLRLLEVLERPESLPRARSAAMTPFVGWRAEDVAGATDEQWDDLQQRMHSWAAILRRYGVATLLEVIGAREHVAERLLSIEGGERELTDLRQLGELLHAAAIEGRLGVTALAGWLRQRMLSDERDPGSDDRMRRLESDAEAVQVLTVHRSKGLEFPVVYCPYLWDPVYISDDNVPAVYHDAENGDVRTLDVAMDEADGQYVQHLQQDHAEQRGEELRLAYVALTRAKYQAVLWWATTYNSRDSSLGRLLFGGTESQGRAYPDPMAAALRERFFALRDAAPEAVSLERADVQPARWSPHQPSEGDLQAAVFDRDLDARWRRLSYTSIVGGRQETRVASEIEEPAGADDPFDHHPLPLVEPTADQQALLDFPSPFADLPTGRGVGTFLHQILEETDFAAPDVEEALAASIHSAQQRRAIRVGGPNELASALAGVIETPLGPTLDDVRLRDMAQGDRLNELSFELPLVGGDEPDGDLTLTTVGVVLEEHLAADDPLRAYAQQLNDPFLRASLRGYLTGTIDLVARVGDRFVIGDYKSNRLATASEALTAWHYRPSALAAEMQRSHYVLQALFYAVALYRYLRWRLPDTEPGSQQILIAYLFLRGMAGAETPRVDDTPCGVFVWEPPASLLPALSDALDRGES